MELIIVFVLKLLGKLSIKTIVITVITAGLIFGIWDYIDTKYDNKTLKINQVKIIEEHKKELIYMSELIREREVQKNDLIDHNKLLQKLNKRRSNVNTNTKTFKSRNLKRVTR